MPICTRCGTQNPDNATVCSKCGIAFMHQRFVNADAKRAKIGTITRSITWVVGLIVLVCVAPSIYHFSAAAYYKHHLQSITERAMRNCNGPVTDTMQPGQVDDINKCLAQDADLQEAKTDYAKFAPDTKH